MSPNRNYQSAGHIRTTSGDLVFRSHGEGFYSAQVHSEEKIPFVLEGLRHEMRLATGWGVRLKDHGLHQMWATDASYFAGWWALQDLNQLGASRRSVA